MKARWCGVLAVGLALLLVLGGCKSVKQVKVTEEQAALLTYGAISAADYGMDNSHLGGILGVTKNEYSDNLYYQGVRSEEDAIRFLNELLITGSRAESDYYVGSDALLGVAQGVLVPSFEMSEEEERYLREGYDAVCERLIERYGYTRAELDAVATVSAFDYDLLIGSARLMFALDLISEEQAWRYIERAAERAAEDYASWEEYAAGFAFGMMMVGDENPRTITATLDPVLWEDDSPYRLVEFGVL